MPSLLAAAAEEAEEGPRRRVLREILYHLGRWIYLADAADDLAKDVARGNLQSRCATAICLHRAVSWMRRRSGRLGPDAWTTPSI